MPGIIEDHEERLQVLEGSRRGVHTDVRDKLTSFSEALEAQARRLTVMEANHTGLQHGEVEALSRRVASMERALQGFQRAVDNVAEHGRVHQADVDRRTEQFVAEFQSSLNVTQAFQAVAIEGYQRKTLEGLEAQRKQVQDLFDSMSARVAELEMREAVRAAWAAQPWWARWWRRIKGERP